ncbi:hypothetical protein FHS28_003804 [Roseateles terrae]|uniref:Uncharacterized protein n=1 Tax=Roseateles terrae TaxID=431060 RepID=A0ABR6GXG4_9BURK|nr:hypothetical protein [Roseateles terrae]
MHRAVQAEVQVEGHASGCGRGGRLAILLRGRGWRSGGRRRTRRGRRGHWRRRWRRERRRPRGRRRGRGCGHIQLRVAADAGGNHAGGPAAQNAVQERRGGQSLQTQEAKNAGQTEVTGGMREHPALISGCCCRPFECRACACGATRHQDADGTGLGKAAEATAVARGAHSGLAGCFRMDPDDARGHGWTLRASGSRLGPQQRPPQRHYFLTPSSRRRSSR